MTREEAVELARKHVKHDPADGYNQDATFDPDGWVINAIMAAYRKGEEDAYWLYMPLPGSQY